MSTKEQILELIKNENPGNPIAYVHNIVQEYSRQKLDNHIKSCEDCDICNGIKSITKGNSNASVLIIGEAVSEDQVEEDIKYVYPFENKSGELLNTVLESLNVNQDEIFYINAVSCRPYKQVGNEIIKRTPSKIEVNNCFTFVNYAIDVVKPQVIILLGGIALNMFKKDSISKARGGWIDIKGIPAMPTYHPGYFIEIEGKKDSEIIDMLKWDFYTDIKNAFKYIQENYSENNVLLAPLESE